MIGNKKNRFHATVVNLKITKNSLVIKILEETQKYGVLFAWFMGKDSNSAYPETPAPKTTILSIIYNLMKKLT